MPGGKGPASPTESDGFLSGNLGLIAIFAGVVLIFGGIVAANQVGLFADGQQGASCDDVFTGADVHEHARLEVYLDSEQPYDFSPERYQQAHRLIHFEHGQGDADGATIHVHQARPTLSCLFETLRWSVSEDRIETDTGEVYEANGEGDIEILVNGEPSERGFAVPITQGDEFVIRYTPAAEDAPETDGNDTGDGNATAQP